MKILLHSLQCLWVKTVSKLLGSSYKVYGRSGKICFSLIIYLIHKEIKEICKSNSLNPHSARQIKIEFRQNYSMLKSYMNPLNHS